jgi:NAD(P)-dependent dehydrogenase (short-subunit alcohol dehydrogenase family)
VSASIDFSGRVAIVTGAGRGIGRAHALALAARGAAVIVNDIDADACREVVAEIGANRGRALSCAGDVSRADVARELVASAFTGFGRLDILINNAGFIRDRSFHKMSLQELDDVLDVHLRGAAYVTHAAWKHFRERRHGRVVFTTSSSALWGNFGQANYDAAKLGIVGLMQALRIEGETCGIRVNSIAPFVMTRMGENIFPEHLREHLAGDSVTALCLYLCADACAVNGEIFEVGARRIGRVRLQASEGIVMRESFGPEDVQAALGSILAQPTAQCHASVRSALDVFMRHVGAS